MDEEKLCVAMRSFLLGPVRLIERRFDIRPRTKRLRDAYKSTKKPAVGRTERRVSRETVGSGAFCSTPSFSAAPGRIVVSKAVGDFSEWDTDVAKYDDALATLIPGLEPWREGS